MQMLDQQTLKSQRWEPFNRDEVFKWMRQMPPSFHEWLVREREIEISQICNLAELVSLCRCQGRIDVLTRLLDLKKEA